MSALGRLAGIEKELDKTGKGAPALTEIPFLVKHTALLAFPRKEIAQMSGEPWLEFLDKSYGGEGFTRGPGRMLPKLAYGSSRELQDISAEEINQLTVVLRQWIQDHRSKI
jgi:hypothetical protein